MDLSNIADLITWLETLTTAAGSGALAAWLIGWLQSRVPATDPDAWLARLIHAPQFVRYLSLVLATGIGAAAAWGLQALAGWELTPALTGLASFAVSQVIHGALNLSAVLPTRPLAKAEEG